MIGFTKQELESTGVMGRLLGNKPTQNALAEINNFLCEAASPVELSTQIVEGFFKKWGFKATEQNLPQRSALYRRLMEFAYINAATAADSLFAEANRLGELLKLPETLCKPAESAAKKAAYFERCRRLVEEQESLSINEINTLFGYDYEDGYDMRRQVFTDHFNKLFIAIAETQRYSPADEAKIRALCTSIDLPYEFKANIDNALTKYRYLWDAENSPLGEVKVDFPLNKNEICHCASQAGLCEHKTVEKEDNYYTLTRKLHIDETISFKGEKLEHPHTTEEINAVIEVGYLFLTNQRFIFLGKKHSSIVNLADVKSVNLATTIIQLELKDDKNAAFKLPDDAAEVMYAILNRIIQDEKYCL